MKKEQIMKNSRITLTGTTLMEVTPETINYDSRVRRR